MLIGFYGRGIYIDRLSEIFKGSFFYTDTFSKSFQIPRTFCLTTPLTVVSMTFLLLCFECGLTYAPLCKHDGKKRVNSSGIWDIYFFKFRPGYKTLSLFETCLDCFKVTSFFHLKRKWYFLSRAFHFHQMWSYASYLDVKKQFRLVYCC